ncbi:preprotein translocase subunit SecE [Mycoplasma sp. 'Moose RK']|uniref:preprotein translocase subunit SecE n=1 Tax=Mycoplasma sp. 'Moose RK' TaxID=2780095 RepID=UPI0018C20635|nr:preprotein translocase subunit SecE [Mycoplasma sp. 'Moose RK']MBG0730649.1 preprotein translocase subunit SecE [Mycoplasma sp. 'Moose RK']
MVKKGPKQKKIKKSREKKHFIRLFLKEMKRVKWPTSSVVFRNFSQSIIFSIFFMIVFFLITVLAAVAWNRAGVGL